MKKGLVIVESPAKAKTIGRFLGSKYSVMASMGHIRDLPKSTLGVDVDNLFEPKYVVPKAKAKVVSQIKTAAAKADAIFLATDPDREGEAISWHLVSAAKLEGNDRELRRVVFHEITADAIKKAFKNTREIDMNLVNAQQARRVLDRLVGYKLSPLLWKKVQRGLSAGRVQSVTVRMVVDREREREAFKADEYWVLQVKLGRTTDEKESFWAKVVKLRNGRKFPVSSEAVAVHTMEQLVSASYSVAKVASREAQRRPTAPFTTSTMQQEASRRLRFSASQTMVVAQQLYEGVALAGGETAGLITYMRTDSPRMSPGAVSEIRDYVTATYGESYIPAKPYRYASKGKFAQEAHECIRPTSVARTPESMKAFLDSRQLRLYRLIWQRAVASEMSPSIYDNAAVTVEATTGDDGGFLLEASASKLKFAGFAVLYSEKADDSPDEEESSQLPDVKEGEHLAYVDSSTEQKFTQPPPRYTEATLVRALEQLGIGRPSTYAPTLSVIQLRDYVAKEAGRFFPTRLGIGVSDLLSEHFPKVVDVGFTAQMEGQLDEIAQGDRDWVSVVSEFYVPFAGVLDGAEERIARVDVTEPTDEVCPNCGKPMIIRSGRFGRFLACTGYPECKTTKPLVKTTGAKCPECGADIVQKRSKKGKTFYGCSAYPNCNFATSRRPVAKACPECGKLMVEQGKGKAKCLSCNAVVSAESEGETDGSSEE
ncbi:MAG: type I DNA topoisomerase [Dehalococcoidia bacterium]|nr:type I DNA topoisomerase [Dehalococcoidia bacterium]